MRKIVLLLGLMIFIIGCSKDVEQQKEGPQQLANPAPVYCEEQGGTLRMEENKAGQYGICVLADGTECEEWAYFKGECPEEIEEEIVPEPEKKTEEKQEVEENIVEIPALVEKNCLGFLPPGPEEMEAIKALGGGWARPHPGPFAWGWIEEEGNFNFRWTDEWVKEASRTTICTHFVRLMVA